MNNYMTNEDLIFNTSTRIAVCICIDLSGSMDNKDGTDKSRIERVEEGIIELFEEITSNEQTQNSAEIAIVTFNDEARVVRNFKIIEDPNEKIEKFMTGGQGNLGVGVLKSLEILEERKNLYKENGVDYYQPWLIIMSDGCPTGSNWKSKMTRSEAKIKQLENNNKLTVIPIIITNNDDESTNETSKGYSNLKRLSNVNDVTPISGTKFSRFFRWLGKSVSAVQGNNNFKLDLSELSDWDDI